VKYSPQKIGFFQAIGVVLYICLFATAVQIVQNWRPSFFMQSGPASGIIIFLLVFVVSATICGAMFLGYPAVLLFEGKKSEAVKTVLWSILWLVIFAIVIGSAFLLLVY
jgi:hypothetical protein